MLLIYPFCSYFPWHWGNIQRDAHTCGITVATTHPLWNRYIIVLTKFWSYETPVVIKMTIYCVASDTTKSSKWGHFRFNSICLYLISRLDFFRSTQETHAIIIGDDSDNKLVITYGKQVHCHNDAVWVVNHIISPANPLLFDYVHGHCDIWVFKSRNNFLL